MINFSDKFRSLNKEEQLYFLRHIPIHLFEAGLSKQLIHLITDLNFIEKKCDAKMVNSLLNDFRLAMNIADTHIGSNLFEHLVAWQKFIRRFAHLLDEHPDQVWQLARNYAHTGTIAEAAIKRTPERPYVTSWLFRRNRPISPIKNSSQIFQINEKITGLQLEPNGKSALVSTVNGNILLLSLSTGLKKYLDHLPPIRGKVRASTDLERLLYQTSQNEIILVNHYNHELWRTRASVAVSDYDCDSTCNRVLILQINGECVLFDTSSGLEIERRMPLENVNVTYRDNFGEIDRIFLAKGFTCHISDDGQWIAVCGGLRLSDYGYLPLSGPNNMEDDFGVAMAWQVGVRNLPKEKRALASAIECSAITEDGELLACAANATRKSMDDRSVVVWNCRKNEKIGFRRFLNPIRKLCVSKSSGFIFCASDKEIYCLKSNTDTVKRLKSNYNIEHLQVTNDGELCVFSDSSYRVNCVEMDPGSKKKESHSTRVQALDISYNGSLIVSGDGAGKVFSWNADKNNRLGSLTTTRQSVERLKLLPDGKGYLLITADLDFHHLEKNKSDLGIFVATSGNAWRIAELQGRVALFELASSGRTLFLACGLASAFGEESPGLWVDPDLLEKDEFYIPPGETPNMNTIPVHGVYWRNRLIRLDFEEPIKPKNISYRVLADNLPRFGKKSTLTINDKYIIGAGDDHVLRVIDVESGNIIAATCACLECYSEKGQYVVCRMHNAPRTLRILKVPSLEPLSQIEVDQIPFAQHSGVISGGSKIIFSDNSQSIVIDVRTGKLLTALRGQLEMCSNDGQWFAVKTSPYCIVIYSSNSLTPKAKYCSTSDISSVAAARSNCMFAVGHEDGTLAALEIQGYRESFYNSVS